MQAADGSADINSARALADLGEPPSDRRARAAWVRQRFVQVGCLWYGSSGSDRGRQSDLEDLAVELLTEHRDVLPSLSTLKREVANWSFLPSTVENLWSRAFPPSVDDRARNTNEWALLETTGSRIADLRRIGDRRRAEALRAAAVSFFNKYLPSDEVGQVLRKKAQQELRKA